MEDTQNTFYGFTQLAKHTDTQWSEEGKPLETDGYFTLENDNFHKMHQGKYANDPLLSRLPDYPSTIPDSVLSYRKNKLKSIPKYD